MSTGVLGQKLVTILEGWRGSLKMPLTLLVHLPLHREARRNIWRCSDRTTSGAGWYGDAVVCVVAGWVYRTDLTDQRATRTRRIYLCFMVKGCMLTAWRTTPKLTTKRLLKVQLHWVPLTKSSVTKSTQLQWRDFFASKAMYQVHTKTEHTRSFYDHMVGKKEDVSNDVDKGGDRPKDWKKNYNGNVTFSDLEMRWLPNRVIILLS